MKRRVLGLDINDEFVAAVVVRQSGHDREVVSCGAARFHQREELGEVLPELLTRVGQREGDSVCGLSLSHVSIRNLTLPFTEKRKISQVLPMELEDQLLMPVDEQLIEYVVIGEEEQASRLLVATMPRKTVKEYLELLRSAGLNPFALTLRTGAVAEQLRRGGGFSEGFVLVDAGLHSANMAIATREKVIFLRRLPYPDRVFTARPFSFSENGPEIINFEVAMECAVSLCGDIRRSLGLFRLESELDSLPEQVVMTGSMSRVAAFREKIGAELDREIHLADLRDQTGTLLGSGVETGWDPGLYDHALALALEGMRKKTVFNFRKEEFAPQKLLLAGRTQLVAAAVLAVLLLGGFTLYLGMDYRRLKARYDELGTRMEAVFRETFPETTRIVDPLLQMKTNVRDVQAPATSTPVFSGDKRTLNILADISGRIPKSVKIHVSRLVIDKESVAIKGTTDTFNNVNLIRSSLRRSPEFEDVAIVSAAAEKDGGMIRFELKLRTAAGGTS
ncbi:MAG: hypothetical protein Kow0089_21310 [Desulfobulbaceae bacterium]